MDYDSQKMQLTIAERNLNSPLSHQNHAYNELTFSLFSQIKVYG